MIRKRGSEVWFTGQHQLAVADYQPQKMELSLKPDQCDVVKSFFRFVLTASQTKNTVSIGQLLLTFRKERNGGLLAKKQKGEN